MTTRDKLAQAIADNIQGADPDSCRYAAIAVLTTLLSPGEGTVEAMYRVHASPTALTGPDKVRRVWRAGLDHILKEGEGA